jgi:bis(5'-nucleosyl)-tetraphosphatase (symmetrical)
MATYAIGDIQGCYDELQELLELIEFDPKKDRLWFVGDLVNRGPHSLEVLRFVKGLGYAAITVLGNHDLHLLAVAHHNPMHRDKDHTLGHILEAKDRGELLEWLRQQPLMHHDKELGFSMIHAGLPPQWDIPTALARAGELEAVLRGPGFHDFLHDMYGNKPSRWSDELEGMDRLRFITNCFTRLRYCTPEGKLKLKEKGAPGSQPEGYLPWFKVPKRASRHDRIIFGHWSTLGYRAKNNIWSIDSGCLWGASLTALRLGENPEPIHLNCPGARKPGEK